MQKNSEEKNLVIKNIVCFIISLCPIYGLKIFGIFLRANGIDTDSDIELMLMTPFIYIVLIITGCLALPCLCATIKYMIDMIKSKTKIVLAVLEIIIYIYIIVNFLLFQMPNR